MVPFSIVVVTHDSADEVAVLLDSIDRHLDPRPEVIVVDTDSSDDIAAIAGGRAQVVELGENPGFGAANNAGVALARGEVTVLLNPDIELLDDGLARLAALAAPQSALLAPRLLNSDRSLQRSAHLEPGRVGAVVPAILHPRVLPRRLRLRAEPWRSESRRTVGWAIAACVAAPTSVLRALGPFDPDHFLFFEDMDLCLNARAHGLPTVFEPAVAVVHSGGHSTSRTYVDEPFDLLARRRHGVVTARLGPRAAALDDAAQAATFATRWLARVLLRRDAGRERRQLAAVVRARRMVA